MAIAVTTEFISEILCSSFLSKMLQIRTVLSFPLDIIYLFVTAKVITDTMCPAKVASFNFSSIFHKIISLSSPPETMYLSSDVIAKVFIV